MDEDAFLEADYEDRNGNQFEDDDTYTRDADWDLEDDIDYWDTSINSHEYDEMRYPEWMERSYAD